MRYDKVHSSFVAESSISPIVIVSESSFATEIGTGMLFNSRILFVAGAAIALRFVSSDACWNIRYFS